MEIGERGSGRRNDGRRCCLAAISSAAAPVAVFIVTSNSLNKEL